MDPVTNKLLQGTPYAGMGGTQERNALIGVIRNLISEDKYTVDYILNYAQSVGYQRQMAEEVFKELTGLSPKLIVNNNEYYNMPSYVPNMCIAWGTSKSNKEKAFYIVPFEYGYAVMEKDEVNAPIPTVISATIPEAFEELKKVAKGIQTLDKIITKKLLETEDVQTDAHTVHQVNLPYAASPLQVLKKNFKDKVLSVSEFERQASKLLASEEITVDEAEDLMAWKQDLIDEDETYGNDVLELDEQWKPLDADVDEDLESFDYTYSLLVNGNIDLYKERLNRMSKAELMDYIAWAEEMGIGREELKLNYITASKKVKSELSADVKSEMEQEAQNIIKKFKPYVIKWEADDNGGSVLIGDKNSDFQAWVDVWISGNDVDCDWNQYITHVNDPKEYRDLQVRNDTETVFDLATSEAIYCLEQNNVIGQDESARWFMVRNNKKNASKKVTAKNLVDNKFYLEMNNLDEEQDSELLNALQKFYDIAGFVPPLWDKDINWYLLSHNLQIAYEKNGGSISNFKGYTSADDQLLTKELLQSLYPNNSSELINLLSDIEDITPSGKVLRKYDDLDSIRFKSRASKKVTASKISDKMKERLTFGYFSPEQEKSLPNFNSTEELETYIKQTNSFPDNFFYKGGLFTMDEYDMSGSTISYSSPEIDMGLEINTPDNRYDHKGDYKNMEISIEEENGPLYRTDITYYIPKSVFDSIYGNKTASKKKASKKVTAENMTLDDIEAEDNKDQVQEEIEKIDETPTEDIFSETTPEQYFDKALQEDKVDTINDVVSKCIDKFSEKFKDFDKYQVKILSYNTKVLEDDKPVQEEMVEDKELNANAILQVILQITNNSEEANIKKVLAVFSITNGELHWTGTVRGENDQVVAFTEEGFDALFEVNEPSEDELEDII